MIIFYQVGLFLKNGRELFYINTTKFINVITFYNDRFPCKL